MGADDGTGKRDYNRGHIWAKNNRGYVDMHAWDTDTGHQGPRCIQCGYVYCSICRYEPDEDCPNAGYLQNVEYIEIGFKDGSHVLLGRDTEPMVWPAPGADENKLAQFVSSWLNGALRHLPNWLKDEE